ncbi:uncharacterized protein LOC129910815 [Episyrphus balteatus]|uniref:uncharacterized protein LOC129910815 n=1 Tax=Episyrphus balteatus TaxID=286459 RepID=UPI002485A86F|nr:uncharacterized protein LOC129910815 [Episyrphus balteatus]
MKLIFKICILVLAVAVYKTNGLCNTCSLIGIACVSETAFSICNDGALDPTVTPTECPTGTFCSASDKVCTASLTEASCTKCKECIEGSEYACVNYTSFTFCTAGVMGVEHYNCPANLACNIASTPICSDPSATGLGATCGRGGPTTAAPPTTTPNPLTDPDTYCLNKGVAGRFNITSDTTCRLFVSCVTVGAVLTGNVYECPPATIFNATAQRCATGTGCATS